jgi:mannitol/fructose-specific phosphotransferase system IIA component (Ntr-type)
MGMSAYIVREAIVSELRATTREGVIAEMVESLRKAGALPADKPEETVRAVLRREQAGSTGIGRGVAMPHAKHGNVGRVIGTLAVSRQGVSFESIDGEPVHVFALLVSPPDQTGAHLRALECVSLRLRDEGFVRALRQAPTPEAIWGLLEGQQRSPETSPRAVTPPSPAAEPTTAYFTVLEHVVRRLGDDGFVNALRRAPTREAIWELLQEAEHHEASCSL